MVLGQFYRWEDHNHGLEHKCGTCATVLSSPRAKKTCFGVHEEVCTAYHKTLHFVGASHRCAACSNTTKAHNKRHLEIAEILQAIHRLQGVSTINSPLCNNKKKGKKEDEPNPDPTDDGSVPRGVLDQEQELRWDSSSSTLNNEDDEVEERQQCWSGAMESADARKAAKAERKAAKNQTLFDITTQEELATIERALHPDAEKQANTSSKGQGLADNHIIDENIAFNANTFKWSKLRQGVHAKKIAKNNSGKQRPNTLEEDNKILGPILVQLGISTASMKANRERRSLDAKLRAAILRDLVAFENDQVETMQRMAGYWRFANKRVYNEMVRNNELWDWATGEKLPEIKEEAELDLKEEDENVETGSRAAETERQIPENWDDPDFELADDEAAPSPNAPIDRSNTNGILAGKFTVTKQSHEGGDANLDEVQLNTDRSGIPKVSSSLEHLADQTISSKVLLPVSGDEIWERLRTDSEYHPDEDTETLIGSSIPGSPLSPMNSKPKDRGVTEFQGVKDTRVFGKAIREASPPSKDPPLSPQPTRNPLLPRTQTRDTPDLLNRFGTLDSEVPAPCEEVKKVDEPLLKSVIKIPAKPIVKTLAIHDEDDDWKTMRRPKGKKRPKGSIAVSLSTRAAVHTKKFTGGKSFVAVVKKGL